MPNPRLVTSSDHGSTSCTTVGLKLPFSPFGPRFSKVPPNFSRCSMKPFWALNCATSPACSPREHSLASGVSTNAYFQSVSAKLMVLAGTDFAGSAWDFETDEVTVAKLAVSVSVSVSDVTRSARRIGFST